jgi:hypothetical protein
MEIVFHGQLAVAHRRDKSTGACGFSGRVFAKTGGFQRQYSRRALVCRKRAGLAPGNGRRDATKDRA